MDTAMFDTYVLDVVPPDEEAIVMRQDTKNRDMTMYIKITTSLQIGKTNRMKKKPTNSQVNLQHSILVNADLYKK